MTLTPTSGSGGRNKTKTLRRAGILALLMIGPALSGCESGLGTAGYREFSDGQYDKARDSFSEDYKNHPDSAVAQINMGDSHRQRGENTQADVYFHQAALSGKNVRPDGMLETHDSNTTVADIACRHLMEDHQTDPNCPN